MLQGMADSAGGPAPSASGLVAWIVDECVWRRGGAGGVRIAFVVVTPAAEAIREMVAVRILEEGDEVFLGPGGSASDLFRKWLASLELRVFRLIGAAVGVLDRPLCLGLVPRGVWPA